MAPNGILKAEQYSNRGYELCKFGKYAEALAYYKKAAKVDPSNHKYWYNVAVACDRMGDNAGMEAACVKTIECNGTFPKGYVRLAKALLRQEKIDQAARAVTTGLLVAPNNAELVALQRDVQNKQEQLTVAAIQRMEIAEKRTHHARGSDPSAVRASSVQPVATAAPKRSSGIKNTRSDPPGPTYPNLAGRGRNSDRPVGYKDQVLTYIVSDSAVQEIPTVPSSSTRPQEPPAAKESAPASRSKSSHRNGGITRRLLRGRDGQKEQAVEI